MTSGLRIGIRTLDFVASNQFFLPFIICHARDALGPNKVAAG